MPTLGQVKAVWDGLAAKFPKGAAYRERLEREKQAQAEREKPAPAPPPDPNIVILTNWIQHDEQAFSALLNMIDGFIQLHAGARREAVGSHAHMAFHDGECAALEQLRQKLTILRG